MIRALVVDDEPDSLSALAEVVEGQGFEVVTAMNLEEARERIGELSVELLVTDLKLPDGNGMDLLVDLEDQPVDVVLVTGHATVESAVEALRQDVVDYLVKPVDIQRLRTVLGHIARSWKLRREVVSLREELRRLGRFGKLVGTSESMQAIYDRVEKVAPTEATVLITGESGTGKELAAETIHQLSPRRDGPFLPVNCGAVSETLIESELFGHEAGAFTGAERRHRGYFERADGGTLFLDEIVEMPTELQVKLLRLLETGRLVRVGGEEEIEVDVRVVAATNVDPAEAVEGGRLREDLHYRLKVFQLDLPPLREREGDVELLLDHFLIKLNSAEDTHKRLTPEARALLLEYPWPGNVRELKNVVYSAFILADEEIGPEHLPADVTDSAGIAGPIVTIRVGMSIADAERKLILATLERLDGDKPAAAEALGISLKTLYNRLKSYEEESAEEEPAGGGEDAGPAGGPVDEEDAEAEASAEDGEGTSGSVK